MPRAVDTTPSAPHDGQARPFHLGYRPSLDGLRGIAALMVMSFHFHVPGWPGGFLGVDLFFVLSGFLITSLLLDEWREVGAIDLRRFYWHRAFRLLPALVVLLVVCAPFVGLLWPLVSIGYVANWALAFGVVQISPLSHVWSLSVEEQFYLLWPILLIGLLTWRRSRWTIIGITAFLAAGSAAFKILGWTNPASWLRLYHGSDARADALLVGCLVGMLVTWDMIPRRNWINRAIQILAVTGIVVLGIFNATAHLDDRVLYQGAGLTVIALSAGAIVLSLVTVPIRPFATLLEWPPLVGIGRISYGLYLWHHPIGWIPTSLGTDTRGQILTFAFRVTLSFLAALTSFWLVERPLLRLRHRYDEKRKVSAIART